MNQACHCMAFFCKNFIKKIKENGQNFDNRRWRDLVWEKA